jgi:serine/threonine protein kinase
MLGPPSAPDHIGPFRFAHFLGSGSYGAVWRATHTSFGLDVAIKVVPKAALEGDGSRVRFLREVALLQRMDHPCISPVFQMLEDDASHYVVMEYAPGGSLLLLVEGGGALPELLARHYFVQLISVLEYLHSDLQIAHRDLKAENVVIDKHGNIRLIDFGFARSVPDESRACACGSARIFRQGGSALP